jgi:two-component system alkaline phosphatase synthesis response regulator PhoP
MQMIYCVEDDESIRDLVVYALKSNQFEAKGFEDGKSLFAALGETLPNLILLDVMLPGEDGISLLKKLKNSPATASIPVIMLTAKSNEYDKVIGLDSGADDYLPKPFGILELVSRIKAVLRRCPGSGGHDHVLSIQNLTVDYDSRTALVDKQPVILTLKEFELLYYLMKNKDIVLSRDKIMSAVWGFDFEGESRTVDMHIKTLRQKLESAGSLIETVRGVGYKIGG